MYFLTKLVPSRLLYRAQAKHCELFCWTIVQKLSNLLFAYQKLFLLKADELNGDALSNSVAWFFSHSTSKTVPKMQKKIRQLCLTEHCGWINSALIWQKLKWQKIFICECEMFCHLIWKTILTFGYDKFNQNCFTDLKLIYKFVNCFQFYLSPQKWQNKFKQK